VGILYYNGIGVHVFICLSF